MKIGIIGTGAVGNRLARLFADTGHEVTLGSRTPDSASGPEGLAVVSVLEVVRSAELVVLAVPFTATGDVLTPLAPALAGKVVVDATNPLNADYSPITLDGGRSAGEVVASLLPGARVVKAWNTVFAEVMTAEKRRRGERLATVFVAGDDADAVALVARLAGDAGFDPVIAGPLWNSRYLEAMAHLNIHLAFAQGGGADAAFLYDRPNCA